MVDNQMYFCASLKMFLSVANEIRFKFYLKIIQTTNKKYQSPLLEYNLIV